MCKNVRVLTVHHAHYPLFFSSRVSGIKLMQYVDLKRKDHLSLFAFHFHIP